MTNYALVNGTLYNDGAYDAATNPYGLANGGHIVNWVPMIAGVIVELAGIQSSAATSASSVAIGTGAKSFTLDAPATLPAGLYLIYRASEIANPVNFMFGNLATEIAASTAFSVTVPTGGTGGSGSYTDWVIVEAGARRSPQRSFSGADTVVATDLGATLRYTGTGHTLAFTAAATLGAGFYTTIAHDGSGTLVLDPAGAETVDGAATISLTAGQSVDIWNTGTKFLVTASKGYGVAANTSPITSTSATKTAAFNFVAGVRYPIDVMTTAAFTGTLPQTPADNDTFEFFEAVPGWVSRNFTCARHGSGTYTIDGSASNLVCDMRYRGRIRLTYKSGPNDMVIS